MSRQIIITLPEWTEIKGINHKEFADLLPAYDEMLYLIKNGTPLDKVLEDIKAEITERWEMYEDRFDVSDCLDIIDKHISGKAESEVLNADNN